MSMIGSGILSKDNIPDDRKEILNGILRQINIFRENAFQEEKTINRDKVKNKQRPNNVISILGGRGSGKTSIALTALKEKKELQQYREKKNVDFDLNIIDPSKFNVEDNALGWIIYSFHDYVMKWEKNKNNKCDDYCKRDEEDNLFSLYEKLKSTYIHSRKFYREKLSALTESRLEYDKVNGEISRADKELENDFRTFIETLCRVKRLQCSQSEDECYNNEPLIIITFDDVDMSPEKGPEILELILNFLNHPNIVCIVLGDYSTFSESLVIDLWNKYKIPAQFNTNTVTNKEKIFDDIIRRANDILGKVLPYNYRFELKDFTLNSRLEFTPFGNSRASDGKTSLPKLYELFDKIFICGYDIKDDKDNVLEKRSTFLKYFIEPLLKIEDIKERIESLHEEISNSNRNPYDGYYDQISGTMGYFNRISELEKESERSLYNKKLNISDYTYALSGTPRGLINLYYKLDEIINSGNTICEFQYLVRQRISINSHAINNRIVDDQSQNNFKLFIKLFDAFYNSNIEVYSKKDNVDINSILDTNTEYNTLFINNEKYYIKNSHYFESSYFNISNELLTIVDNEEHNALSKDKSAFIQLFYDLGKMFLGNKFKENSHWKFNEVCLYERKKDFIKYNTIDYKYFYDYYIFQKLYKYSLPLIIRDRRVPADIRNRLKAISISILEFISDDERKIKNRLTDNIIYINKLSYYQISDIKNRNQIINTIGNNYSEEGIDIFIESDNIVHSIMSGDEQEYYNIGDLSILLSKSEYYFACNKILTVSDNTKKGLSQRCEEIKEVIINCDNIDNKEIMGELLKSADHRNWNQIKIVLLILNEDIITYLCNQIENADMNKNKKIELLENIKDICRKLYSRVNNNKDYEAKGINSYFTIQDRINEYINEVNKLKIKRIDTIEASTMLAKDFDEEVFNIIEDFLCRKVVQVVIREELIRRLKQIENDINVPKELIGSINLDNFKEKMDELTNKMVKKWAQMLMTDKIEKLYKSSTDKNREKILYVLNQIKETEIINKLKGEYEEIE